MKVLIRRIRHSDYLGIIDLFNDCFDKNVMYHDIENNENKIVIVAEIENEIVGCAEIDILKNEIENYKYATINNVCVKKIYQRNGIGSLIMEACDKICLENNCSYINLTANSSRIAGVALYKKMGYEIVNTNLLKKSLI